MRQFFKFMFASMLGTLLLSVLMFILFIGFIAALGSAFSLEGKAPSVPASTVRRITDQIVADGRATHPWFGLSYAVVPPGAAQARGVSSALFVSSVAAGGPAARAGVRGGDLIAGIAGGPADSFTIGRLLATAAVGDEVVLDLLREGPPQQVTVTLAEAP